jgi:hypothetical protein
MPMTTAQLRAASIDLVAGTPVKVVVTQADGTETECEIVRVVTRHARGSETFTLIVKEKV